MKHSLKTPRFVKSTTAKGLERLMLENNLKRSTWHDYQIVFDGKLWFAWFYVDLSGSYNQEILEIKKEG
jgi:hypothetical protein